MGTKKRDDFKTTVVKTLRDRVNNLCSNPDCGNLTVEPQKTDNNKINITGTAAHICAAAVGGPRYDESMSSEERKSINNGIWLCNHCARKIDTEPKAYTVALLKEWKKKAELKVLVNSNKPLYTETQLTKTINSKVLESQMSGKNFGSVASNSLNSISKAVQEELRILDPRISILCNHINNETHYIIDVVEDSEEPVNVTFKPSDSYEYREKYSKLIEHGESFKTSLETFKSNSDALNAIFPSEIKDGILIIKPTQNYKAFIEITDENKNIILELENEFIIGSKSFSIYAKKFDNLFSISLEKILFTRQENIETKTDISINFSNWQNKDLRYLPYFDQIKKAYIKIQDAKNVNLKILVEGYEVYSASSNKIPDQVSSIVNFLKYTECCRKIAKKLNIVIPFSIDVNFTSREHRQLFEVAERLSSSIEQKKFKGSMVVKPISRQEIEKIFERDNLEIIMYQTLPISDLNIFGRIVNFDVYLKHIFISPKINLIKELKDKCSYKYEIRENNENSLYIRESCLEPFDQREHQIIIK